MENTRDLIDQLKECSPTGKVIYSKQLDPDEWVRVVEPATWEIADIKYKDGNSFIAMLDSAYGKVALFKNRKLQSVGKHSAETDEAIAIWPDYYGLNTVYF